MSRDLNVTQISEVLNATASTFIAYCTTLPDVQFFYQPGDKWSAAQQVKHLIKATDTSRLAFTLPRFMVRLVGGKPNRPSRTYVELVNKYKLKLEAGGKATGRYIPKAIPSSYGKEKLLTDFGGSMKKISTAISKWKDIELDKYIAPHPLLGKITLRELAYFTIHHTEHHQESIRSIINN